MYTNLIFTKISQQIRTNAILDNLPLRSQFVRPPLARSLFWTMCNTFENNISKEAEYSCEQTTREADDCSYAAVCKGTSCAHWLIHLVVQLRLPFKTTLFAILQHNLLPHDIQQIQKKGKCSDALQRLSKVNEEWNGIRLWV